MKTAVYIEDGFVQLVLTPGNEFEKNALLGLTGGPAAYGDQRKLHASIRRGSFYHCVAGHYMQNGDDSLIITAEPETKAVPYDAEAHAACYR